MAAPAAADAKKKGPVPVDHVALTALLASLESVVVDLNDMENMIDTYDDSMAEPLYAKVNEYIRDLKEVQKLGPTCTMQVPLEALERLDNDLEQNPEVFAQELLTRCGDEFGQLNTRIQGIQNVRKIVTDGWRETPGGDKDAAGPRREGNGKGAGADVKGMRRGAAGAGRA